MITCELCTDDVNIHIVQKCNHNNICFLCIIKLRIKTANERCPFCNAFDDEIILTDKPDVAYEELDTSNIIPYQSGLYFENQKIKEEVDEFNQIKCPIPKCTDTTVYHNINNLKKHLKEKHNRYFCDICLDHRTLVFKEQKLFTSAQLDRHMKKGDLDDEGNVVFFHPYCKFSDKFFYDEEVLIKHLREDHYKCDLCDQDRKFFFFNKYDNLEIHYNLSHYLCQDEVCRKSHTVFRTAAELEHHSMKFHADKSAVSNKQMKNVNQNLIMSMTNFNYGNTEIHKKSYGKTSIKDREGVDFEPQILSQRRFHTKFHTETEVSGDEKFDIRRYFPYNQIRELYIDESEGRKKEFQDVEFHEEEGGHERGGYRGYRGRGRGGRGGSQKSQNEKQYVRKNSGKEELVLENCNMASYVSLAMTRDELFQELRKVLDDTQRKTLQSKITDYYRGRINESTLFDAWVEALDKRLVFKVFPFFIASCENAETCKILDEHFYQQMLKLPRRNDAFIYDFKVYRDFFKGLSAEIEQNIINRIKDGKLNYENKNYVMDTPRVFQLIQIVKRLSNPDMASFKFAINFGLSPKTKETVNDLLLHDKGQVQQKLGTISEQEIFILLKYLQLCKNKLEKVIDNLAFSKISKNLLEEIFAISPDIKTLFEKKLGKEEFKKLTEKEYIDYEPKPALPDKSGMPKLPTSKYEERKEEAKVDPQSVDAKNKFEFPDLKKNISGKDTLPLPPQQKKKKIGTEPGTGWEKRENPYGYGGAKKNEVELKKQIEQDFPTLVNETKRGEQANYWNKLDKQGKTSGTATVGDWGKPKGGIVDEYQEEEETFEDMAIGVVQKKGKKNKTKNTVYLTGGFK